jgi:multidrug transporter EmrE-like cation transporter
VRWFFLLFAMVVNAGASVLMKVGSKHAEKNPLTVGASLLDKGFHFLNGWTIVAIFLFAVNVLAYRRALDEFDLKLAYPVMVCGGLVLVTAAAWLLPMLSEKIYWWQIAGIALIGVGVWLLFLVPSTPAAH